jgi:hypothetical protein
MSQVFVSYKHEDRDRVSRLVVALESHGLSVWWDCSLAGGEQWRNDIEAALGNAECVIVVWTRGSTGPDSHFVRDEARRAMVRGILVPVLFDRVDPPLGFGELQAVDLTSWRGRASDPFVLDLLATIRAKIAGSPVPDPKGPLIRLKRRVVAGMGGTALAALSWGLATNVFSIQQRICTLPMGQPTLSDVCGAVGLAGRPTRDERIAWESRTPSSCDSLRAHIQRFPQGVYRASAADMLTARRVRTDEIWSPTKLPLVLNGDSNGPPAADESRAKSDALRRAHLPAERLCRTFVASGEYRLQAVDVQPQNWQCSSLGRGVVCSFQGEVICSLEERVVVERETCEQ